MNDTSPKVADIMRRMLMQRSGEERMMMGFSMYECAREMVEASLKAEGLEKGTVEFRRRYLTRVYGADFTPEQIEIIAIRGAAKKSG